MSNQLLPCPCCGGKPMEMQYDGILWVQCEDCALNTAACDASADYVQLWNRRATQPVAGEALVFANELISGALEGGDFSGADIQEVAVKHGLLREEQREEACRDEGCACAEYGFPTECYRKTAALAPPAAAPVAAGEPVAIANRGKGAFWVRWTDAAEGLYGPGIKLYAAPPAAAHGDEVVRFDYVGPKQERRTVVVYRDEIAEHMQEQLFHKLTVAVCMCDPDDSDNCRCDEYAEQFAMRAQGDGGGS